MSRNLLPSPRSVRVSVISAVVILVVAACASVDEAQPTPLPAPSWATDLDSAWTHHREGNVPAAISAYDEALASMPNDDRSLGTRTGATISLGDALLLAGNGQRASEVAAEANELLEQATETEKLETAWNIMMAQAMMVSGADLLVTSIRANRPLEDDIERLKFVSTFVDLPEIHFYLAMGYRTMGDIATARDEYQLFLDAPDDVVGSLGKPESTDGQGWTT